MRTLTLFACALCAQAWSQSSPPAPAPVVKPAQPSQAAANSQKESRTKERGTNESTLFVGPFPNSGSREKAADTKSKTVDQPAPDWWMVGLTAVIALIGAVQTAVFGIQARRLRQTILKMDAIAADQTRDVRDSIAQATRAAEAMEGIAESMATNVGSVRETVAINREIADRRKLVTELQSRAYLTVVFDVMVPQSIATELRFEPS